MIGATGVWPLASSRTLVVGVAVLAFGVCCLLPIGYVVASALSEWHGLRLLLLDARQRQLLLNTAALGLGTAITATAMGVPLGAILARRTLPYTGAVRVALTAPMLLPPYVAALAWTYLTGHASWASGTIAASGILGLLSYPLPMLATEAALRRVDGRLEEAGLLAATPQVVLRRITLPLVAPTIAGAGLVVFMLACSEFAVPSLLRVRVYTTEVFTAFAALYDVDRATILALPLVLLCLTVGVLASWVVHARPIATRRGTRVPSPMPSLPRAVAAIGVSAVVASALLLPTIVMANEARAVRSWSAVFGGSLEAIVNSLVWSAVGASSVVGLATVLGYAGARLSPRQGRTLDAVLVAAFGIPSTIIGVALIGLWNRPGPLGMVYGTDAILVLGFVARLVPVATLLVVAMARAVPTAHEEAAAVSGAGWFRSFWHVVLPQLRRGLGAAWLLTFVLAFGELGVSLLVAPPGEATLPIRVYTLIANAPASHVAALALLQTAVILVPVAAIGAMASTVWDRS